MKFIHFVVQKSQRPEGCARYGAIFKETGGSFVISPLNCTMFCAPLYLIVYGHQGLCWAMVII
jgi:hypothetical protein